MCAAADGSCTLLVEGATTAGPAALIYNTLQLHTALWLRSRPQLRCFAVLALLVLSFLLPASTAGAGGLSLVYAPLQAPQPLSAVLSLLATILC